MIKNFMYRFFCKGKTKNGMHKWAVFEQGRYAWNDVYRCTKCGRKKWTWL